MKYEQVANDILETMRAEARRCLGNASWWQFNQRSYWRGVLFATMAFRQGVVKAEKSGHLLKSKGQDDAH